MSEPEQLELPMIDPPQLDSKDIEILSEMLVELKKDYQECDQNQIGWTQRKVLDNIHVCVFLLEQKLPEVNKLISRRYELEQLLEKQND